MTDRATSFDPVFYYYLSACVELLSGTRTPGLFFGSSLVIRYTKIAATRKANNACQSLGVDWSARTDSNVAPQAHFRSTRGISAPQDGQVLVSAAPQNSQTELSVAQVS